MKDTYATSLEKCQSYEHVLLFRNAIVQYHDTPPPPHMSPKERYVSKI